MSIFSQNLPKLRRRAGYTQEGLAEALEVSRQAVGKWEAGQTLPEAATLLELAELLNCSLDQLMRLPLEEEPLPPEPDGGEEVWRAYERHMNQFAVQISSGVALCLMGVAALLALLVVVGPLPAPAAPVPPPAAPAWPGRGTPGPSPPGRTSPSKAPAARWSPPRRPG